MQKNMLYIVSLLALLGAAAYLVIKQPFFNDIFQQKTIATVPVSNAINANKIEPVQTDVPAIETQVEIQAELPEPASTGVTDADAVATNSITTNSMPADSSTANNNAAISNVNAQTESNQSNPHADPNILTSEIPHVRVLLIPEKETTISSAIAARIVTFNGTLGQSFKQGDTLVAFDCEEALARVNMSKAELAGAIDQHEAKVKMQGLDQASDVEVALAASAVNKNKAQLSLNQAQVSQCRIYAPWAGRVAKVIAKNHMTVTPGQPLMELVNAGPLKLKLNAPSKLISKLKIGTKFNVQIDETGNQYTTAVSAVNSRVDPVSQTVEIEARMVKSYPELLSGMSGVADFSGL